MFVPAKMLAMAAAICPADDRDIRYAQHLDNGVYNVQECSACGTRFNDNQPTWVWAYQGRMVRMHIACCLAFIPRVHREFELEIRAAVEMLAVLDTALTSSDAHL